MNRHTKNYLKCVCHDRLYSLGVYDLKHRQKLVGRVIAGKTVVIRRKRINLGVIEQ